MHGMRLCLGLNDHFPLERTEQVRALREIGFEGFFQMEIR